jgi:hypothetical protein
MKFAVHPQHRDPDRFVATLGVDQALRSCDHGKSAILVHANRCDLVQPPLVHQVDDLANVRIDGPHVEQLEDQRSGHGRVDHLEDGSRPAGTDQFAGHADNPSVRALEFELRLTSRQQTLRYRRLCASGNPHR